MSNKKRLPRYLIYLSLLIITIVLLVLDVPYFDICPIHILTGFNCPTCGLTRAFLYLIKFDLEKSLTYNPLVILFFPLIVFIVFEDIIKGIFFKDKKSFVERYLWK
ncbi:MAG: DUF2752 domain-containing protein [Bacillales bacterium]|jgi:asparagine N-glycosylation enzyme membrane subunit Stt3|nr:DUF2752 domain-containing protein [Bacillales bacterium]